MPFLSFFCELLPLPMLSLLLVRVQDWLPVSHSTDSIDTIVVYVQFRMWYFFAGLPVFFGRLLMLPVNMGFAVGVDVDVQAHGVAADRAVLHVVLTRSG